MAEALRESIRPILRHEYDQMVKLGLFEDERVELLDGVLVTMSPIGPDHDAAVSWLTKVFVRAVGDRAEVRPQCTFGAGRSAPQPDLALVPPGSYRKAHPEAALLIVEVSNSSLRTDRGVKARIYATAGVPEYWVVNLVDEQVEVFRDPTGDSYRVTTVARRGDPLEPATLPEVIVDVAELFG